MEPTAISDNPEIDFQSRRAAALGRCGATCRRKPCTPCTEWRNFLPATQKAHLEAVHDRLHAEADAARKDFLNGFYPRAGRPLAPNEFDVVAGPMSVGRVEFIPTYGEPAVEAPRPPALPEHPAIEITLALRRASAMDRQRRIAAQLLVDLGVSGEVIDLAIAKLTAECGAFPQMTPEIHVRAVFDAVLAEILA